jgi:hypothetical protein
LLVLSVTTQLSKSRSHQLCTTSLLISMFCYMFRLMKNHHQADIHYQLILKLLNCYLHGYVTVLQLLLIHQIFCISLKLLKLMFFINIYLSRIKTLLNDINKCSYNGIKCNIIINYKCLKLEDIIIKYT